MEMDTKGNISPSPSSPQEAVTEDTEHAAINKRPCWGVYIKRLAGVNFDHELSIEFQS